MVHTFDAAKTYDGTPLVGEGEVWRLVGDETVTLTVTGNAGGSTGGSASRAATPHTGDHATSAPLVALVLGVIGAVLCVLSRRFT